MPTTIQIPDDLYVALQRLAIPFVDREPADVIWRLVREDQSVSGEQLASSASTTAGRATGREPSRTRRPPSSAIGRPPEGPSATRGAREGGGLLASGVTIPNGLRLRFNHKGKILPGRVRDDRIWVGDRPYVSPSAAAAAAAIALGTTGGALNGWYYWEYEDPAAPGEWRRLENLRKEGERRRRRRHA
jgi:hypothetical protein